MLLAPTQFTQLPLTNSQELVYFFLSRTEQLPPSKDAAWSSKKNNANRKDKTFWKSVPPGPLKNLKKKKDNKLNLEQSICNNIIVLWKFHHIMKEEP